MLSMASAPPTTKAGMVASRSAPTENGASPDQITMPWYSASARSTASIRPSMTSGLMACILFLMLAIKTWPSSVQVRSALDSDRVVPAVCQSGRLASPSNFSGKSCLS